MEELIDKEPEFLTSLPLKTKQTLVQIGTDIEIRVVNIKRDYFQIGKSLSDAKKILPHGKFQDWVEFRFRKELPYATANLYMKIYEKFRHQPKTIQYLPITFLMNISQKSFPEEIFNIIMENANSDKLDIKEIGDAYSLYKKGDIGMSEFENIARRQIDLAIQMEYGRTERRMQEEFSRTISFGFASLFNNIRKIRKVTNKRLFLVYPHHKHYILSDIDKSIRELNDFRQYIEQDEGFFRREADPITGKIDLKNNPKFENSNN